MAYFHSFRKHCLRVEYLFATVFSVLLLYSDCITPVLAVQSFSQQPSDTAVNLGAASVILPCVVNDKSGEIFWTKDGNVLGFPGTPRYSLVGDKAAGEYNLQISDVILTDDGVYQCQVTAHVGHPGITSNLARLTVQRAPGSISVIGSPTLSVIVSVPVNLTCIVNGANPAATITWFRGDTLLEGAVYTSGRATNDQSGKLWDAESTLTITPALIDHGILYECRAINAATETPVTAGLTLDVQHPPVVAVETIPAEVREETTIICRCVVDANPRQVEYIWMKNDEILAGAASNQMELLVTKEDHGATIKCIAKNAIGTTEGTMELNVQYGPRLVETPVSVSVDAGSPAHMTCIADGNPTPTTKWTRLGSRATLSTMQRLQFDSVRESDVGVYVCTASVPGFDSVSSVGRLYLNTIPIIDSEPIQKAKLRSTAVLECHTSSKPDPYTIQWSWDGGELETGIDGRYSAERVEGEGGGVTSYLRIEKADNQDFDEYNCTMWNDIGVQSKIITLEQQGMDLILYIIIGVVGASVFIFIVTIITLAYCRRRFRKKKAKDEEPEKDAIQVEIIPQMMSLKEALEKDKKKKNERDDGSPRSSGSRPRYAMPHEFVSRRRESWEDPHYRTLPDRRGQVNEYMEPHHFDRRPSPPWNDKFLDHDDDPYHRRDDLGYHDDDEDPYIKRHDSFSKRDDPEPIYRDRSLRSQHSRRSDHDDYVDPRDFHDHDHPYSRYDSERDDDYDDRYSYDNMSAKDSEASYNSKDRLATNV